MTKTDWSMNWNWALEAFSVPTVSDWKTQSAAASVRSPFPGSLAVTVPWTSWACRYRPRLPRLYGRCAA